MRHPLAGAWLKFNRAKEHVHAFGVEQHSFTYRELNRISTQYQPEIDSWTMEGAPGFVEPPDRLGILIGDALHNFRGSLDYLVFELAKRGNKGVEVEKTQFPICTTEGAWETARRDRLREVETENVTIIDGFQPYKGLDEGLDPDLHVLSFLRELNDRDKHRLLVTTTGRVVRGGGNVPAMDMPLDMFVRNGGGFGYGYPRFIPNDANIPGGIGDANPEPQVDMNRAVTPYITFAEAPAMGAPVVDLLAQIAGAVREVLRSFLDAFAKPLA